MRAATINRLAFDLVRAERRKLLSEKERAVTGAGGRGSSASSAPAAATAAVTAANTRRGAYRTAVFTIAKQAIRTSKRSPHLSIKVLAFIRKIIDIQPRDIPIWIRSFSKQTKKT